MSDLLDALLRIIHSKNLSVKISFINNHQGNINKKE
jgi:hypothetical protein